MTQRSRPHRTSRNRVTATIGLAVACLGSTLPADIATAQQMPGVVISMPPPPSGAPPPSMPGIVLSTPPGGPGAPPPMPGVVLSTPPGGPPPGLITPSAPPVGASAPAQQPAAKPKPKPAPRKVAGPDPGAGDPKAPQGIAALVNDEPVTAFEVDRLARFMALSTNISDRAKANMKSFAEDPRTTERIKEILKETIEANQTKTREQVIAIFEERKKQYVLSLQKRAVESARASSIPGLRKKALDEIIDDRLKHQEAKRVSIVVGEDDVNRAFKSIAERNKLSLQEFTNNIRVQGADPDVMKGRLKTQLVWREVIRKRFGHTISISNREIDQVVQSSKRGEEQTELQLQKITISTAGKIDQRVMAQRMNEAEALRARFAGCKGTQGLVKDRTDAKFEDLGFRKASSVSEPTRTLLVNARDGEMVPANLAAGGVELYAVCGRRTVKVDDEKRQQVESELQMREFERIAQRHLQDLRKDALIEIR